MYRSVLCLMSIALAGCMGASEPADPGTSSQPLSSAESDEASANDSATKPPLPVPPQGPGKPGAVAIPEECIAKVKQCYAEGGDEEKCQVINEKCLPPKPEFHGCVEPEGGASAEDAAPPCSKPPGPVDVAGCVIEKKCHVDKDGDEECETFVSNCRTPPDVPAPGAPAPAAAGGIGKGCGEPGNLLRQPSRVCKRSSRAWQKKMMPRHARP